jgi:Tol biopolymer transport system component
MNADGTDQRDLTPDLTKRRIEAWKPAPVSNTEAVFTERTRQDDPYSDNLFVLDLHSGHTQPLTENSLSNWFPDYDANMRRLVFITKQQQDEHDVLATMRTDGLDCRVVVTLPGDNNDPSWSADGRYFTFVNNNGGDYSTYMASADGSTLWLLDRSPKGSDDLSPLLIG